MITEQTFPIACRGGLDLTTNTQELLQKPGWASKLVNFEPSNDGGYRRINGQTILGSGSIPEANTERVKGLKWVDNKLLVACQNGNVYISYDLNNWAQVNKLMTLGNGGAPGPGASPGPGGSQVNPMNYTELQAATTLARDNSDQYHFHVFRQGTSSIIMGSCGGHNPFVLIVSGSTIENSSYTYYELSISSGSLSGAFHGGKYEDQYIVSGMPSATSEIYYSDILKPWDFEGANAGSIGFNDTVVGLQMFRNSLYVFCEHSIHRVSGLNTGSPLREEVTSKIGCIHGASIQEMAGDLVFLSHDGLRTLGATERIGDVNLAPLSDSVNAKLREITQNIGDYSIESEVLKNKVQYRLFCNPGVGSTASQYSLVLHMGKGAQGNILPAFSEISGFDVRAIDNSMYEGKERTATGDSQGNLWFHDEGNDMNGTNIVFIYETPFFSIEDPGVRKNVHKLITYIKAEGLTEFNIAVKYDHDSPLSYQPVPYTIDKLLSPSLYGKDDYNLGVYGASKFPIITTLIEGSGKTISLRIFPSGNRCDPFSLQGFDLHFINAGRI